MSWDHTLPGAPQRTWKSVARLEGRSDVDALAGDRKRHAAHAAASNSSAALSLTGGRAVVEVVESAWALLVIVTRARLSRPRMASQPVR